MSAITPAIKPADKPRTIPPIAMRDSDAARLYAHIHPVVVLSGYLARFGAVVQDPVRELTLLLLPLAALQSVYLVLCLPAVERSSGTHLKSTSGKAGLKKRARGRGEDVPLAKAVPAMLSLLLSLILGPPLLTIMLVLFGAPFTTHLQHTLLCSAHMSLLAALPLIYVYGVDIEKWRMAASLMLPIDEVFGAALGTLMGAWVGAVPIPLDWDREWQKWPVTIVTGAYLVWSIGKVAGGLLLRGKVIDMKP